MINASSKIRLFINNSEYSDHLIEGSLSDDSAYTTNIITTKGSVVLGGDTSILDFKKIYSPLDPLLLFMRHLVMVKLLSCRGDIFMYSALQLT